MPFAATVLGTSYPLIEPTDLTADPLLSDSRVTRTLTLRVARPPGSAALALVAADGLSWSELPLSSSLWYCCAVCWP